MGMRMSPKNSSRAFCLIFSSRLFFALFSKPEYVCTTYHFLSIFVPAIALIFFLQTRVLDLVSEELPEDVEHAEEDRRDQAGDDDSDGRRARVGPAAPAALAPRDHDV